MRYFTVYDVARSCLLTIVGGEVWRAYDDAYCCQLLGIVSYPYRFGIMGARRDATIVIVCTRTLCYNEYDGLWLVGSVARTQLTDDHFVSQASAVGQPTRSNSAFHPYGVDK